MKKVKFENGKYGVRAYWFFGWYFVDLMNPTLTWPAGSGYFIYCIGTEEQADEAIFLRRAKHTVCK